MSEFAGIWVPLITPFASNGEVDDASLSKLVTELVDAGIAGFVVCGTTGEPAALNKQEKQRVLSAVLSHCAQAPVVMGISGITPTEVITQIEQWNRSPIAGYLLPPPYYVRPSQPGIINFYTEAAHAAAQPIIVYDIPYRTGVQLELTTMRSLANIAGIGAVKDCGGDARKTQALIADRQLQILAGEDQQIFTNLCQGGAGAIAASAHLHPQLFVALYQAIQSGDLYTARTLHHALAPMIHCLFREPNPAPVKAVLAALQRTTALLREPMTQATDAVADEALRAYQQVLQVNAAVSA